MHPHPNGSLPKFIATHIPTSLGFSFSTWLAVNNFFGLFSFSRSFMQKVKVIQSVHSYIQKYAPLMFTKNLMVFNKILIYLMIINELEVYPSISTDRATSRY